MSKTLSYLVGAGLAAPEGVLGVPLAAFTPTDSLEGLVDVGVDVDVMTRRVGIRDWEPSSEDTTEIPIKSLFTRHSLFSPLPVLSSDSVDPWRDGGFDPALLRGRELGLELPKDPPGVRPVLVGTDGFLCVNLPWLLSLSLNESGVDADNDDREGRDIATDLWDFSRT